MRRSRGFTRGGAEDHRFALVASRPALCLSILRIDAMIAAEFTHSVDQILESMSLL